MAQLAAKPLIAAKGGVQVGDPHPPATRRSRATLTSSQGRIRTTTIFILALGLLADSAVGVVAQDEADPTAQAVVTGTVRWQREVSPGTTTSDAGVSRTEGRQSVNFWDASDPRLRGEETVTTNWHRYAAPDISVREVGVGAMTRVLVNEGGRWVGPTGIGLEMGLQEGERDIVVMRGEGAYEGLTAIIVMEDLSDDTAAFVGAIVPGEMPPFPEPPAE